MPRLTTLAAVSGATALGLVAASLAGAAYARRRTPRAEQRNPPVGRFVDVEGGGLHYLQRGSGSDVVLIHGAAVTLNDMAAGPMDALAGDHRVTAFDRPGHGYSDGALERGSACDQAETIREGVRALGLERPVLVGQSLGGAVALAYGALFPEEIAGVVAVAPLAYPGWGVGHVGPAMHAAPGVGAVLSNSLFALGDPAMMHLATKAIFAPQKPTERFLAEFPSELVGRPASMRADGSDLIRTSAALERLSRSYASYPAPVHVLVGAKDKVLKPARQGLKLARELKDARLTEMPELGHMLHHFAIAELVAAVEEVRARGDGGDAAEQRLAA